MLISEPAVLRPHPLLLILNTDANAENNELMTGVYQISHFGSSSFLRGYDPCPYLSINEFGVCDSVEQLLEACPELQNSERKFVVTVTPIRKAEEPVKDGWRWHKWGQYIGTQNSVCEYLYDEPEIEEILCYHIYEKIT